jgi:acetoin utilization deacetylase AcuC-like enzyme
VRTLRAEGFGGSTLILDCDVHQGDGTAALFRDDPLVFTFSIHGRKTFPHRKVAGDLDIGLDDHTGDAAFLSDLREGIELVARRFTPDLVIYVAGADPYRRDRFGRMALTKAGLLERDRMVFDRYRGRAVPVAVTLGGGYAPDPADIVDIHANTVGAAAGFR